MGPWTLLPCYPEKERGGGGGGGGGIGGERERERESERDTNLYILHCKVFSHRN